MIRIGDGPLTSAAIRAIADKTEDAGLAPSVYDRVAAAHGDAAHLSSRHPTYGRTTGVGANRGTLIEKADADHGLRLLRSHAADAGAELPARQVRAMLAVRLNQLSVPGSGISPNILLKLEEMLQRDALPSIRAHGAIGTGDLTALAGTALTMMGERQASNELTPMAPWNSDSALPFISSSALTIARSALAVADLKDLEKASSVIFALTFSALQGNPSAFSAAAAVASAAPGVRATARRVRGLLDGSDAAVSARIQDPYGLRTYAITQAGLRTALRRLGKHIRALSASAQENPLFDFANECVVHHSAFFQSALSLGIDATTLALANTATITMARIRMINEPAHTGLRPFLATGPAGASGLMMIEYIAGSTIAEIRNSAQPASLGHLVLSRGAEEDASFATQGATQLERAAVAYRTLLACELLGAVRLIRQSGIREKLPALLARLVLLTDELTENDEDRDLRDDITQAESLLDRLTKI